MDTSKNKNKFLLIAFLLFVAVFVWFVFLRNSDKQNVENDNAMVAVYNDGWQNNGVNLLTSFENVISGPCTKNGTACSGHLITEKVSNNWKKFAFSFEAIGDGTVYIDLRSAIQQNEDGSTYVPSIDYRKFAVNGAEVFADEATYSFTNTYQYPLNVKNGDVVEVEVEMKNHQESNK